MSNLTEVDRLPVMVMNSTPYFRVPRCLRDQMNEETSQYETVYARDIQSGHLVIRIEKIPPSKDAS